MTALPGTGCHPAGGFAACAPELNGSVIGTTVNLSVTTPGEAGPVFVFLGVDFALLPPLPLPWMEACPGVTCNVNVLSPSPVLLLGSAPLVPISISLPNIPLPAVYAQTLVVGAGLKLSNAVEIL